MSGERGSSRRVVILVDDDPDQLALLTAQVERDRGFVTRAFDRAESALEAASEDAPDAVVTDLRMPGMDGLELTRRLRAAHPSLPIIVITGAAGEEAAEAVLEAGATDFVTKPVHPANLIVRLQRSVEGVPGRELLLDAARKQFDPHGIIGEHPRVQEVRSFVRSVAAVPGVSALILGESGTGKNLVARAIHGAGDASNYRFMEINCAALPGSLLEAELFGYEKGAFTDAAQAKKGIVEVADGGTLFLDEIGSMPLDLQTKLLSFLESRSFRRLGSTEDRSVDLRVVAATNAELQEEVRKGGFREDLFYRLNVARIVLPPLREIRSDIPELARHMLAKAADYFRKLAPGLDVDTLRRLQAYDWPGNVRELRNVIERALIFSSGEWLRVDDIVPLAPDAARERGAAADGGGTAGAVVLPRGLTLDEVERRYIEETMREVEGQVAEAAERLGVTRKVLWARRKKHGLLDGD